VRRRGWDFLRYLLRLSELELLDRERRATERRIRQAKFDVIKSLDTFDFLAIPSLNKSLVLDLARCEFIERKENILALGNSGTGKTHIAGPGPDAAHRSDKEARNTGQEPSIHCDLRGLKIGPRAGLDASWQSSRDGGG
jgi:hypothetical protein